MLRYLEKHNDDSIKAAVGISVPWDISELSKEVSKPRNFIYDYGITRNFKRNLRWNLDVFEKVSEAKNLDLCIYNIINILKVGAL